MHIGDKVIYIKESNETFYNGSKYTIKSISSHKCKEMTEQLIELKEINEGSTCCHICRKDLEGCYFVGSMFQHIPVKLNNIKIL
jgi:hypothetical protein